MARGRHAGLLLLILLGAGGCQILNPSQPTPSTSGESAAQVQGGPARVETATSAAQRAPVEGVKPLAPAGQAALPIGPPPTELPPPASNGSSLAPPTGEDPSQPPPAMGNHSPAPPAGDQSRDLRAPQPLPPGGDVVHLELPPLQPGDLRLPINLAAALKLADARPLIVTLAQAKAWQAEAKMQQASVLWLPDFYIGFDYTRHDGYGPDTLSGVNVQPGFNALGQPDPASFGKALNQNINYFYGGGAFYYMVYLTDVIFEPLRARQDLNSKRWDIQAAKNDALLMTARAYFNVHKFRGQYAGALDVVDKGRNLVAALLAQRKDLIQGVEVDRARNLLADMEQQAATARQFWRRASIDLTQVLRLDPRVVVEPVEKDHLQITLIEPSRPLNELMPIGLTNRPELASHQAEIQAMLVSVKREKMRACLPSPILTGFQTPYEMLEFGVLGIGQGSSLNQWNPRYDIAPQLLWQASSLGLGNLAMVKRQRSQTSKAIVELFAAQDAVVAEMTRAQASLQSAAVRVVQAEHELRSARINYQGNIDGLMQTKRFGDVLEQLFRPQEVVFSLQLLKTAYDRYFQTVAEYNQAQFELFHAMGYPAQELSQQNPPGDSMPVDTGRPSYLPAVGTGPPPATR